MKECWLAGQTLGSITVVWIELFAFAHVFYYELSLNKEPMKLKTTQMHCNSHDTLFIIISEKSHLFHR